jgi:hypothetical protein
VTAQSLFPILLAVLFGALVLGLIFVAIWLDRKRTEALANAAAALGLSFTPAHDRQLARDYEHLRGLHEGEDRYAFDVMTGSHGDWPVTLFDFHYETRSTDSKGNSTTTSYHRHAVLLHLERSFPALVLSPEGLFSKIAQAFGYDDIDFESHEFSRRYCVRSPDKRFAYDFCNPAMIEFLLADSGASLELSGDVLAFVREGRMEPERIASELAFAGAVRERMPAYLFAA